ncbi:MAG: hypothetical protein NZO16_00045 [Deltaproteobacteria bacterium]|nr:hypothetical protein [Deltaproteobacteria bacterium]
MIRSFKSFAQSDILRARRTAFVSKFIILRENKVSRAHEIIEKLAWDDTDSHYTLAKAFEKIFNFFGEDKSYMKDIEKALLSAKSLSAAFIKEYATRSGKCFLEALLDHERSIFILFGSEYLRLLLGWTPASFLARNYSPIHVDDLSSYLRSLRQLKKNTTKKTLASKKTDKFKLS